jgi:hypothetical protein
MRHRENRRIRESFYKTQRNVQASNQKIKNDFNKFDAMRHRENRKMRNDFGKIGNDFKNIGKTINTGIKSTFKMIGKSGIFGGGKRGGGGGGGSSGGSGEGSGAYTEAGQNGEGAGSGGMSESGSAINSGIPSALSHISDMTGTNSSSLIPLAIGVAVVGFFIFSKKK